jgi:ComF family protein
MQLFFNNPITDFFNLLYPRLCPACNKLLKQGEKEICIPCAFDLPYTDFHLYKENPLAKQFWGRVPIHAAMALLYFTKGGRTQNLIHHLKYKDQPDIGLFLGRAIGLRLLQSDAYSGIDLLLPVPLHPRRQRLRGYNQSDYIARGISEALQVPIATNVLYRNVSTATQTKKDRYDRYINLQQVFNVKQPAAISNKHVLLIDDVITTGATLEACAQTIYLNQPIKISVAAAAYTL